MKVLKFLDDHLEEIICVVVLAAMTAVIFIQIVLRLLSSKIHFSMAWTEEVGRYLFIYAVYVGAALATHKNAHQKVDLLPLFFGEKGKLVFRLISNIGVILFAGVMTYYGWEVVENVAFVNIQKAPATRINMGWAYGGSALGMTLCTFRAIENIVLELKAWGKKKDDVSAAGGEG